MKDGSWRLAEGDRPAKETRESESGAELTTVKGLDRRISPRLGTCRAFEVCFI